SPATWSAAFWQRDRKPSTSRSSSSSAISAARVSSAIAGYQVGYFTTCQGSTALERSIISVSVVNGSLSCWSSCAPATTVTLLESAAESCEVAFDSSARSSSRAAGLFAARSGTNQPAPG